MWQSSRTGSVSYERTSIVNVLFTNGITELTAFVLRETAYYNLCPCDLPAEPVLLIRVVSDSLTVADRTVNLLALICTVIRMDLWPSSDAKPQM